VGGGPHQGGCTYDGQDCSQTPPSSGPQPANITGRLYCFYDQENLPDTRIYSTDSYGTVIRDAISGAPPAGQNNYGLIDVLPSPGSNYFSVRAGFGSGASNAAYKLPGSPPPYCSQVPWANSYESCVFPEVEGESVSGFDFISDKRVTQGQMGGSCNDPDGDGNLSFKPTWFHNSVADKYILRVFDPLLPVAQGGPLVHYRWYWVGGGGTYNVNCPSGICSVNINDQFCEGSSPCVDIIEDRSYNWDVRIVDSDGAVGGGAWHCKSPARTITCDSSCAPPAPPDVLVIPPGGCISPGQPKDVLFAWASVPNATYSVQVNEEEPFEQPGTSYLHEVNITNPTVTVKVKTNISCGSSEWSNPETFTAPICSVIGPWFQAQGGSVIAGGLASGTFGEIKSDVAVDDFLIANDPESGSVGVAMFGGNDGNGMLSINGEGASTENWSAKSPMHFSAGEYDFAYFDSRVPSDVVINTDDYIIDETTMEPDNFNTSGYDYGGYRWFKKDNGDLTITGANATFGNNKIILLVDGNLAINRRIIYNPQGLFIAIVSGNITIRNELPNFNDDLMGFYFTDKEFITNSDGDDTQLTVRGVVSAKEGFNLNRVNASNGTTPAERFVFAPEDVFKFPPYFSKKNLIWREVAP